MNIIKEINILLEDFSFQSRNLKGREKDKENIEKLKLEKLNKEYPIGEIKQFKISGTLMSKKFLIKDKLKCLYKSATMGDIYYIKVESLKTNKIELLRLLDNGKWVISDSELFAKTYNSR